MISYIDFTSPNVQFAYDLRNNPMFSKDNHNFINALSVQQLNTLGNVSLLDIFLSQSNVVEPHTHQNASELVYCISGSAVVSLINPFTKQLINIPITPGQVANVPQGWWHYEIAMVDNTHLLAIFDAPVPEFIAGSDLLRLTPANILAHTYCLDENKVKDTLAPITDTVVIGPPSDCKPAHYHQPYNQESYSASPYYNHPQPQVFHANRPGQPTTYQPAGNIGNGWNYTG